MHTRTLRSVISILTVAATMLFVGCASDLSGGDAPVVIVIHGGAGTILKANMSLEQETAYREKLSEALQTGYAVLQNGGSSLDAVVATIQVMEDSPLFNAGIGAVFTSEETNELDSSIMDGSTRNAGSVAGVKTIKSPIAAARLVMESSPHVMMVGRGAETFARENGLEMVENSYFRTERRLRQLKRAQQNESQASVFPYGSEVGDSLLSPGADRFGTVGAVALDRVGNIAAGTSTGGMTNKRFGRVGDAPIIGAGTYADNATCGVSATGHGEYFIRGVIAHDVAARMAYARETLQQAAETVIMETLGEMGGTGGLIALDREGNIAMPFNTEGMYRGYIDSAGNEVILIYGEGEE